MSTPILPGATGGLAEALNILLDKGLVIDASIRVTVIGIEILAIEVKVIIASVDTYIRYLEAMQRLEVQRRQLEASTPTTPPPVSQGLAGTLGILTPAPVGVGLGPVLAQPQSAAPETEKQQ